MIPNMTPGAAAQLVSSTPQKTTLSNLETPIFLLKSNLHIDRLMVEDDDGRSINVLSSADIMRSKYAETISGELFDNAAAMLSASHYKPVRLLLMPEGARGSSFPVHNSEIAYRLQSRYTLRQFCDLENWLYQMGVFSLMVSKDNGLVRTCGADENPEMSIRQWITDTCRCGDI